MKDKSSSAPSMQLVNLDTSIRPSNKESMSDLEADLNKPDNFLVWSVVNTILFSSLLGVFAVIYSLRTIEYYKYRHNYAVSEEYSRKALRLNIFSTVIGIIAYISFAYILAIKYTP